MISKAPNDLMETNQNEALHISPEYEYSGFTNVMNMLRFFGNRPDGGLVPWAPSTSGGARTGTGRRSNSLVDLGHPGREVRDRLRADPADSAGRLRPGRPGVGDSWRGQHPPGAGNPRRGAGA